MTALNVRPYSAPDREAVYRIAADTAYFGEPVEAFLDDRRLFCEAFCAYYALLAPEYTWVAEAEGRVVGFLLGCPDTARHDNVWMWKVLPRVLGRAVRGRYGLGTRTWRYAIASLGAALRGEFPHVDLSLYPAHLHINLDARWRGLGAGRRLMEAYIAQLRGLHVHGVHLRTTSLNRAAVHLYARVGFSVLDARPTHLWTRYVTEPVENRVYGLRLG